MPREKIGKADLLDLDRQIDAYNELENPTHSQILLLQKNLAQANLYPADQINGTPNALMDFSMAVVSNPDLAQRALIGFINLPAGTAAPDQSLAAQISLNRAGYSASMDTFDSAEFKSALSQYKQDHPLPLTDQQIDLIVSEVASQAPLDAIDGKIEIRRNSANGLVDEQLSQIQKAGMLIKPLSPDEKILLNQTIGQELAQFSQTIPHLNPEKLAELQSFQQSPIILRATPDQISSKSFISQRMEMRVIWEAGNQAIEAAGGRVEAIDGSHADGGKREIFTRDRFIMVGDKAYLPDVDFYSKDDPDYASYKGEIDQARKTLQSRGIETIDVKGTWFEGGNIIQHEKSHTIFMGLAPEDDPQNAQRLITKINETQNTSRTMLAVPMVEYDRMGVYHLDLAMSEPLSNGKMMFDQNITDAHTRQRIEDIIGEKNIIPITREEAVQGSANILQIGKTAIMTNVSDRLKSILDQEGISYISSSDFEKTGNADIDKSLERDGLGIGNGGMHCMGQAIGSEPIANIQPKTSSPILQPAL